MPGFIIKPISQREHPKIYLCIGLGMSPRIHEALSLIPNAQTHIAVSVSQF
jgi:hypothetical protein